MQNNDMDQYKLLFLGSGNIAKAIIKGITQAGFSPGNISVYDNDTEKTALLSNDYKVDVVEEVASFKKGYVFICVKPNDYSVMLKQIGENISKDVYILSCMAGVPLSKLEKDFKHNECLRFMPNILIENGNGFTAVASQSKTLIDDLNKIFNGASAVTEMKEHMFDLITGSAGSGPAWFYEFINSYIIAIEESGFSSDEAKSITLSLLNGVAEKVDNTTNLENLINQVASPGGTTEAGLKVLEDKNMKRILHETINEAAKRSRELFDENK